MIMHRGFGKFPRTVPWLVATASALLIALNVSAALASTIFPNTRIRLTLVQWMPTKGSYEQWTAVGGDYTVSDEGTIIVPLLGAISVENKDEAALASAIAKALKERIGLVDEPAASVEIIKYPPIYVMGDVKNPGEYEFRTGMTVLQALALGGGELQAPDTTASPEVVIKLVGDAKEIDDSIMRTAAKIERLEAEMAGQTTFQSKQEPNDAVAIAVGRQEEAIFSARANELSRQTKSLTALRDLLSSEIGVLEEKMKSTDANINSAQQQLDSTIALVERGALVATRQAEAERTMRSYQDTRLDLTVLIMRARQSISQTTRDLEGLADRRQTEIASTLQTERALMSSLQLKKATAQKVLMETLSSGASLEPAGKPKIEYMIVHNNGGKSTETLATETTSMAPGDVLKITRNAPHPTPPSISPDTSEPIVPDAGQ
ncbi:polysaccharide biosynthesis/export family protein [Rhizobium sp. 57MFTsu3.2]|uniref:polysaccharide biosynthesis/export family protein n=1 Tax=Rhizobium sp. 57MFTsu3.2 TaxID=1048681 RepID=UPI00146CF49C|nr:polysaccharide biosynthesis/export family protein [Rhizobium sp. 57MFTsu3.2]NMN73148.1 polysaccharide export outer membrane protein [Rhizobium sp. 57MFTsu3.2]